MTPEQEARDILERMKIEGAQNFSAGELGELANIIADARRWRELPDYIKASDNKRRAAIILNNQRIAAYEQKAKAITGRHLA